MIYEKQLTAQLISLSIGACVGLAVWCIWQGLSTIPKQDRTLLDNPPTGFAIIWPLLQVFVHYFGRYLSAKYRQQTAERLIRAGAEYRVTPEQFYVAKVIAALLFSAMLFLTMLLLDRSSILLIVVAALCGYYYPEIWLREAISQRSNLIIRALPYYLDVITLAIESGTNLTGGITHAVQKSPEGPLRHEFSRVLRDIRAGKARSVSLREMSDRSGGAAISNLVSSMIQAEHSGSSLGPVLRAQAEQLRNNRFLKAEKLAMEAPVKLLGPLVMFIFPTTFLVIGFVILSKALSANIITWAPLVWAYSWPG